MNKKRLRLLLIPLLIAVVIAVVQIIKSCSLDGLEGNDFILKDKENVDNVNLFIENMDDMMALYLSGITTADAFRLDVELLVKQWKLLHADHKQFIEDNPILPDTHSIASKVGYDAVISYYSEIQNLMDELATIDDYSNKDRVSYTYLAYQQRIIKQYTSYIYAYEMIKD